MAEGDARWGGWDDESDARGLARWVWGKGTEFEEWAKRMEILRLIKSLQTE